MFDTENCVFGRIWFTEEILNGNILSLCSGNTSEYASALNPILLHISLQYLIKCVLGLCNEGITRSSGSHMFFEIDVLINFAKCSFYKICDSESLRFLLKRDSNTGVFLVNFAKFLKRVFFVEHFWIVKKHLGRRFFCWIETGDEVVIKTSSTNFGSNLSEFKRIHKFLFSPKIIHLIHLNLLNVRSEIGRRPLIEPEFENNPVFNTVYTFFMHIFGLQA